MTLKVGLVPMETTIEPCCYLNGFLYCLVIASLCKVGLKLGPVKALRVITFKLLLTPRDDQLPEVDERGAIIHANHLQ